MVKGLDIFRERFRGYSDRYVLIGGTAPSLGASAYMLVVAGVVTLLVGVSRMVLGVHYPTDVLGGWIGGVVWALFCWLVARRLSRASSPAC